MANTVSIISYSNTFGELVTTQNSLARENNDLAANNYIKSTGTLFLNDPSLGLQVGANAVFESGLLVSGVGSYAKIDNNLSANGQVYFTNPTLGLTNFGQANVYGLLFANASANSIVATNNVTVGGNTFITGSVYSANNLVIAGTGLINGATNIHGTTNIANTLLVSQNTYVRYASIADQFLANTNIRTPIAYVVNLVDASTGMGQFNILTSNTLYSPLGYISTLQSNSSINTASVNTKTLYAETLSTPTANVINTLDANNASGFIKNLQIGGQLTVSGNFVTTGQQIYASNVFTLSAGSSTGINSSIAVNRGSSGANAALRWNEAQKYWDVLDVDGGSYQQVLTTGTVINTLTSSSTLYPASASAANTLNTLLNNANNFLQIAVTNAGSFGNGAFARANSAFDAANNVAPQIQPTYDRANASYARANTSANSFVGTSGVMTPYNGSITFSSNNGIKIETGSGSNTFFFSTPQNLRTSDSPTFAGLTLSTPLQVTQGGTGAQSSGVALQNLLPSTVGIPSGYVLGTTGGLGASFNWVAGGTGGGGSGQTPGTMISTNRLTYTAADNQVDFTTPTYVTGSGQLRVYVNGVRQYTADYTETSTSSVRMTSALKSGDNVMIEVDGFYTWNNWANNTTFTSPFGGIVSSANTVQAAIQDVETRKATLASPTFTGLPQAPTVGTSTANNVLATTGFVANYLGAGYTLSSSITGNAGTVTNGVYTNGSYIDPTWLSISKAKVGLGNVDNTADTNKSVKYATSAGSADSASTAGSAATATTANALNISNDYRMNSLGVGTGASGTSGEIRAYNNITAYYGLSDIRLKENIVPLNGALGKLDGISAYNFNYKTRPNQKMIGVIAQELMQAYPELVYETTPIDSGTGLDKIYAVNYELLSVVLLQSIKELKAEVEELKGQIK